LVNCVRTGSWRIMSCRDGSNSSDSSDSSDSTKQPSPGYAQVGERAVHCHSHIIHGLIWRYLAVLQALAVRFLCDFWDSKGWRRWQAKCKTFGPEDVALLVLCEALLRRGVLCCAVPCHAVWKVGCYARTEGRRLRSKAKHRLKLGIEIETGLYCQSWLLCEILWAFQSEQAT